MRNFKNAIAALASVAVLAMAAPAAEAAFVLTLDDGSGPVSVTDGGAGDLNALVGVITVSQGINGWIVNATTGISKPIFANSAGLAHMDMSSVNVSSTAAGGTMRLWLTDTSFVPAPAGTLLGNVGGTVAAGATNSATFYGCKDPTNRGVCDGQSPIAVNLGPFFGGAFAGTASTNHGILANPYSMTLAAIITHDAGVNSTSFDFELKNVPEPASMLLLGLGLLGAGAYRRR